jgi:hypothetical protein
MFIAFSCCATGKDLQATTKAKTDKIEAELQKQYVRLS